MRCLTQQLITEISANHSHSDYLRLAKKYCTGLSCKKHDNNVQISYSPTDV